MSIEIEVPFDALERPGVAKALANLMMALGGQPLEAAAPAAAPAAPAPAPAAPAKKRAPRKPRAKKAPARKPRARRAAPAPAAPAAEAPADDKWAAYVAALPEPSRKFLQILEAQGTLSVADAVSTLGLKSSKAMGGLTGAMKRWAPKKGVELPYRKDKDADGNRIWVWTRS